MKHSLHSLLTIGAAMLLGSPAFGATMILHSFTGASGDGRQPLGLLTLSGSNLYGMTSSGGSSNFGTIFTMNTDGTGFGLLHSFTGGTGDGREPLGSLTLSGSKLYGMTQNGGASNAGTLFSMNTDGTGFSLLHSFIGGASDGRLPNGSLTLSGSKLYGMTSVGGTSDNGTIFTMNTDGTGFGLLHSFIGGVGDGRGPFGSLTLSSSKLYGMTGGGGASDDGTIFNMNTDGTGFGLLHTFTFGSSDGSQPDGSLTLSGSKFYGMTSGGGSSYRGTIFSMNTDGTGFGLLHSFTGGASDGEQPHGSLTLSGSTLYGMTAFGGNSGFGTIFNINTNGTGFGLLESFGGADGAIPYCDLTLSADASTLYGMTNVGGTGNQGTVFSRAIVPEPGAFALLGLGSLLFTVRRRSARA